MKTDFLKNLGITEQSVIDQIMAENGRDVNKVRDELETYKTQINDLKGQIGAKDSEINTLKAKADQVDGLTQQVNQLTADKNQLTNDLNTKVSEIQKSHAIESGVRDAKAKNVKAVMALLDMEKITFADGNLTGLNEQLDTLQKGEDTKFLFNGTTHEPPAGTDISNPNITGGNNPPTTNTLAGAIAKAIGGNK